MHRSNGYERTDEMRIAGRRENTADRALQKYRSSLMKVLKFNATKLYERLQLYNIW